MSAPPAIELEQLRIVRGGNTVLDDVTVSVSEGIITGLLGPAGMSILGWLWLADLSSSGL